MESNSNKPGSQIKRGPRQVDGFFSPKQTSQARKPSAGTRQSQPRPQPARNMPPPQSYLPDKPRLKKQSTNWWKWSFLGLLVLILLALTAAATYYFALHTKKTQAPSAVQPAQNSRQVTNDAAGLKFAITKDFTPIGDTELKQLNPGFIYGFKPADVAGVMCIVSQTGRDQPGLISSEALRNGVLQELKGAYPDAEMANPGDRPLKNGTAATFMTISYTGENNIKSTRMMLVSVTDKHITFAFCNSPESLFDFYKPEFDDFFSSLEVY